jgi:hypothetical protein
MVQFRLSASCTVASTQPSVAIPVTMSVRTPRECKAGTCLTESDDNTFLHNNYINNTRNVIVDRSFGGSSSDNWDRSYPLGGNYWSNHNGTDFFCGPYQDEEGSDGIADTFYMIDEENRDDYPLMDPFVPQDTAGGLCDRDFQLRTDYTDLRHAYDVLLWNFTQLHGDYEDLQDATGNLDAAHAATAGELDRLRNLAYGLIVMTVILSGAATVLATTAYRRRHTANGTDQGE